MGAFQIAGATIRQNVGGIDIPPLSTAIGLPSIVNVTN